MLNKISRSISNTLDSKSARNYSFPIVHGTCIRNATSPLLQDAKYHLPHLDSTSFAVTDIALTEIQG